MNRLQKKCFIATIGFHLLLAVILLVGPGFFTPNPTVTGIPELSSTIIILPAPPSTSERPVVMPPVNLGAPNRNTPPVRSPNPPPIKPNMDPVVRIPFSTNSDQHSPVSAPNNSNAEQRQRADAIQKAIENLKNHFTTGTDVTLPGSSEAMDPNYVAIVKARYDAAWNPAGGTASDDANTKVSVTIRSDGTVISALILNPSGAAAVDGSVQRTLDRVKFVAPFPEGAKETEKTFIINFNLKAKRQLG
jgi:TonB family protein